MNSKTNIGKYKILREIGEGGMGKVYLARDDQLQRDVCLKVLSDKFASDNNFHERFKQEARSASSLNHPNIITIYEIAEDDGQMFIATEFIEGQTLRELLDSSTLSLGKTLEIATQIAASLAAAHETGIIHRDIKPENIMVRKDGLVKILDFGIAKLFEKEIGESESEAETRLRVNTSVGLVLGTLNYMSPEQARGYKVDPRTDIWSFGVVFYEMLTRKFPFEGETTSDIMAAILMTETTKMDRVDVEIPEKVKEIVFKCLEKNVADRYQDSQDVLDDLKKCQETDGNLNEINISKLPRGKFSTFKSEEEKTRILAAPRTSKNSDLFTRFSHNKWVFVSVGLIVLVLMIGAGFWAYKDYIANPSEIRSIAVLPFENTKRNPETEYLSDGITESLINEFSRLSGLTVKARSSVFLYKDKELNLPRIADELKVDSILTGRITLTDEIILLSLELVDSRTGNLLWGETFKRPMNEIIKLQDDIVKQVSGKLHTNPNKNAGEETAKNYTENSQAYQYYLKGRYYLNKRTKEDFEKAILNFRKAIDVEPTYALAYAGLSDCYTEMTYWSFGLPNEMMPKARAAAQKALKLDGSLAEAHSSIAIVAEDFEWDFTKAEREYKRSIQLNPNRADIFDRYGGLLCEQKRFDEGMSKLENAFELDPLSPGIEMSKAACLYQKRDYDKAIDVLQNTIRTNPDFLPVFSLLGAIYIRKGMNEKTIEAWLKNSPLENYSTKKVGELKRAFESSGIKGFLQKDIEFRKEKLDQGSNQTLFIAMQYANMGDKEEAINWLEKAFEEKHLWVGELNVDPAWDIIRDETRFQAIVNKVGFSKRGI